MRFLFRQIDPASVQSVLVVQTCNPELLQHVAADAKKRFANAKVTVLIQRGMRPFLPPQLSDEVWENQTTGRRKLLRRLRARRFDAACVIWSGERGFWKLKLLPFALGVRAVWAYDRLAKPTRLGLGNISRRLGDVGPANVARLNSRRLMAPITFWRLWRFYRKRCRNKWV
jgi:hypothetical protein